jgi:hypothetical protein
MGLSLIEAANHETRVERLAVIKTFSEGQLISRLPFRNLLAVISMWTARSWTSTARRPGPARPSRRCARCASPWRRR